METLDPLVWNVREEPKQAVAANRFETPVMSTERLGPDDTWHVHLTAWPR